MTHDYTRKGGIVHAEIMLPAHAPPEFADRSTLWNSVEQIEKARDSQLAREIEAALPRELSIAFDEFQSIYLEPEKEDEKKRGASTLLALGENVGQAV